MNVYDFMIDIDLKSYCIGIVVLFRYSFKPICEHLGLFMLVECTCKTFL